MKIYSIKDTKIGKMANPFYQYNDETAIRLIKAIVNSKNNNDELALFPEDKALYNIGEFNEDTGEITSKVEFIANCIEFKNIQKGE